MTHVHQKPQVWIPGTTVIGLLAITHQSLWMDEGSTVFKALIPSLSDWWRMTLHLGGSDVQMPVYMFMVWLWQKTGFVTEYALRLVNLPWFLLGAFALRRVPFWIPIYVCSPFVLYYLGELRPYAMQIAGGVFAASALIRVASGAREGESSKGLTEACIATLLLVAASLSAVVWAIGIWVAVFILRPGWLKEKTFWLRIGLWAPILALFAGYYLYTMLKGYRAAGGLEGGLLSMAFGFYELGGFSGLGPGRGELRAGVSSVFPYLPILIPCGVIMAAAWLMGVNSIIKRISRLECLAVMVAVGVPLAIFVGVSLFMDFRVLGRHLSPMLPVVLLPLAVFLGNTRKKILPKTLGVAVLLIQVASSSQLRLAERHARDDYRTATAIAIQALQENRRVRWQADMNAARYYAHRAGGWDMIHFIQVLESDVPQRLMDADLVIVSRPELAFGSGEYRKEMEANMFYLDKKLNGFEVWKAR